MALLAPGQILGAYTIEGPLGRGGMAEVYRATQRRLDRPVAIKVISPAFHADPTFALRFLREARAVARLEHPHIIAVYDFGEEGDLAYLVMQLATGGTFRDRARGFRTLGEAVAGLAPIGEALQHAHERGVIHRDVKPINVLIDATGRPLLADFGLARVASESLDLTATGMSAGSPQYMAPEQALGSKLDHRADLYAYGIMACEVIGGQLPYSGNTPWAIVYQHLAAPPPSLCALLPDAPSALDDAIRRATAKRPEERYESTAAFVAALRRVAAAAPDLPIGAQRRAPRSGAALPHLPEPGQGGAHQLTGATASARVPALDHPPARATDQEEATVLHIPPPPVPPPPSLLPGLAPSDTRGGRPTAFSRPQWAALGAVGAAVIGLVVAAVGRAEVLSAHGDAVRSALAAFALLLALLNVTLMRVAVFQDAHAALETYRRLRQNHRFVGYTSALIAVAVQVLTWIAIARGQLAPPWAAANLACGLALVALAVAKVGVVRFAPGQRQYLPWIAGALLASYVLVLASGVGGTLAAPGPVASATGAMATAVPTAVVTPVPSAPATALVVPVVPTAPLTPTATPQATATAAAMMTTGPPTATPPLAPPGGYAADFRTWPTGAGPDAGSARFDPVSGEYLLAAAGSAVAVVRYAPGEQAFADFALDVDVRRATGPDDGSYGLAFWVQPIASGAGRARAVFEIAPAGTWRLYLIGANGAREEVQPPAPSSAIRRGDATNHLTVTARGGVVALAINGQVVGTFALETATTGGLGLAVTVPAGAPGVAAAFSNLRLAPAP